MDKLFSVEQNLEIEIHVKLSMSVHVQYDY